MWGEKLIKDTVMHINSVYAHLCVYNGIGCIRQWEMSYFGPKITTVEHMNLVDVSTPCDVMR